MRLIQFDEQCVVKRSSGFDKYCNPVASIVHNGPCLYQENSVMMAQGVYVRRATVALQGKIDVETNDIVEVSKINDGPIVGVVEDVDIVVLPISQETVTVLTLKQGM